MVGIPAEKAEVTRTVLAVLIEKAVPMPRPYSEKIPVPVPVPVGYGGHAGKGRSALSLD